MHKQQKQTIPVYLNVYDFNCMNCCLQYIGLGAYHTGIQIKNIQFCYCVFDNKADQTGVIGIDPQSAQFKFNRKTYLGQTNLSSVQIEQRIQKLAEKFSIGEYHMFKNNCNHFSNQLSAEIINKSLPRQFFRLTDCLRYLCFCLPKKIVNGQFAYQLLFGEEVDPQNILIENQQEDISHLNMNYNKQTHPKNKQKS